DRLPPVQQNLFNELSKDPDLYGILRPREQEGLGIKSVCRETALLFLTLREPGKIPAYVQALLTDQYSQVITALVLDGILEIDWGGKYVSGASASMLFSTQEWLTTNIGPIARLSIQALQYAQELEITDPLKLSARLYFYNRHPCSPVWQQQFPTPEA